VEKLGSEHQAWFAVTKDEGAVREFVERCFVAELYALRRIDAFTVQLRIDRIGSDLAGMELAPDCQEAVVVSATAESAWAMSGRERSRLVEEEQFREAARLLERCAVPPAELEPAR
jgi:hypothetical protein